MCLLIHSLMSSTHKKLTHVFKSNLKFRRPKKKHQFPPMQQKLPNSSNWLVIVGTRNSTSSAKPFSSLTLISPPFPIHIQTTANNSASKLNLSTVKFFKTLKTGSRILWLFRSISLGETEQLYSQKL